jgi:predicted molibdopterin-dependent oxidoreductase YjgC
VPGQERHRWVRLREHCYMCMKCGTGYRNEHQTRGDWIRRWFPADGGYIIAAHTPPCSRGRFTVDRLDKYALALEEAHERAAAARS